MSRLIDAWNNLLTDAVTNDFDEQEYACFRVALVLDRHNTPHQLDPILYEDNLSRELLRLTLDQRRQGDAVDYLAKLTENHPERAATTLFALTKANASLMLPQLLQLISSQGQNWQDNARIEAVNGLRAAIRQDQSHIKTIQQHPSVLPIIESWIDASDPTLATRAENLYDRLSPSADTHTHEDE